MGEEASQRKPVGGLGPPERPRDLALRQPYRQRAKKRFGQHFLRDPRILGRIVEAADVRPGDRVLEIGPGPGYLTRALLGAGAIVTAVELDRDIYAYLREEFSGEENLELIEADALRLDFRALAERAGSPMKVVSNPPYNITGPLVARFIEERDAFTKIVLMLQKEVASRLVAGPGTRAAGSLTVLLWLYFDVRSAFDVPARAFSPPPDVDSTLLVMDPLGGPRVEVGDEDFFREVVKTAFSSRRKTLGNALGRMVSPKSVLLEAFEIAGIDPRRRAETLSIEEFARLATALHGPEDRA